MWQHGLLEAKWKPVLSLVDTVVGILDKACLLSEECRLQVFSAHYLVNEVSRRFLSILNGGTENVLSGFLKVTQWLNLGLAPTFSCL